jgi:hypothetical protein
MTADKPKQQDDDHQIDPSLKDKGKKQPTDPAEPTPVNPTGQRRENESDANRDRDGQRKRAEEGL